uniref:Uncharacterized protein n=3 Tax=Parascaris univalens TaxID=6257 RepID=A0A915AYI4_PARUN
MKAMKSELIDLEDGEIVENEFVNDIKEVIHDSVTSRKSMSYHDRIIVSDSIRSNSSSCITEESNNRDANIRKRRRSIYCEKNQSGKCIEMNISKEKKTSEEICNDQKEIDRNIESTKKVIKIEPHDELNEISDDRWIFELLGESREAITSQSSSKAIDSVDNSAIRIGELEKEYQQLLEDRRKIEEAFARDKKQFVANFYTLLVTARHQIQILNADKRSLIEKLEANCAMKCPSCGHFFSMKKNLLRPERIRVTKGTNTVELRFEKFDMLRRWLNLNNLDRDVDGLPVWMERQSEVVTLASTRSSITAIINSQSAQQRKLVDVTESISNTKTRPMNASITTVKPIVHKDRSGIAPEVRRQNLTSRDSAERRHIETEIAEKYDAHDCSRQGSSKANGDRDRKTDSLQDRRVSHHVVDMRRRLCGRIEKRSRSPIMGRDFCSTERDRRRRHVDR